MSLLARVQYGGGTIVLVTFFSPSLLGFPVPSRFRVVLFFFSFC